MREDSKRQFIKHQLTTTPYVTAEFNGKKTEHHGYHAKNAGEWTTHTVVVTGTGGQDKITFRETTTDAGDDSTGYVTQTSILLL